MAVFKDTVTGVVVSTSRDDAVFLPPGSWERLDEPVSVPEPASASLGAQTRTAPATSEAPAVPDVEPDAAGVPGFGNERSVLGVMVDPGLVEGEITPEPAPETLESRPVKPARKTSRKKTAK